MGKLFSLRWLVVAFFSLAAFPAMADRVFTDQIGARVVLPDRIERAVVLFHQALDVIVQIDAQSQVVGVLRDWDKRLGPGFRKIAPQLMKVPQPGELTTVNMEELLKLEPDVVIMPHFAPAEVRQKVEAAGIPVVMLAFAILPPSERGKQDPSLPNEKQAYTEGLIEAVTLLGRIFNKEAAATQVVDAILSGRRTVDELTSNLGLSKRTKVYFAGKDLSTRGAGKYTGVIIDSAGGTNVAAEISGIKKVSIEQILAWNPEVIIIEDRSPEVADEIRGNPAWATVKAVQDGRIHVLPEFVRPGGHPAPESVALGEMYMARLFHPDLLKNVDVTGKVRDFYRTFYRSDNSGMQ